MLKKILVFIVVIFGAQVMANTGWSGHLSPNQTLEDLVREQIYKDYQIKCTKIDDSEAQSEFKIAKVFSLKPIIEVTRVDSEYDYFGSLPPRFEISLKTYDSTVMDYIEQDIVVDVYYNQLDQKLDLKYVEGTEISCR